MPEMILEPETIEILEPDLSNVVTEDDEPVDNIFSEKQQRLLTETLFTSWDRGPDEKRSFVALANVGLFYAVNEPAIVPDVMVSVDVQLPDELWEKKHRSYFMWEYGKPPEIVVEVVSNRKGRELVEKQRLYARLGITYYIVFDPDQQLKKEQLHVFERRDSGYGRRQSTWLPVLGLGQVLWEGEYEGQHEVWLRWCDQAGNLLLTGAEGIEQERQHAERERQRAEQERQRSERLAAQLRAAGLDPEG
jgi:Uma2 family endonuclease